MVPKKSAIGLLLILILTGCQLLETNENALNGNITVWSSWNEAEKVVLERALNEFQGANPHITITHVTHSPGELLDNFIEAGKDGLAPDLLIGPVEWIGALADAGMIRPLASEDIGDKKLDAMAAELAGYQDKIYGIPLSLFPQALYYNKAKVDRPVSTLSELLTEAAGGKEVALPQNFRDAYWGIQVFGRGLFDENDNFRMEGSGFPDWLAWLNKAQNEPGVILSVDDEAMLDLFVEGGSAYYVARPDKLSVLDIRMGEDAYGVATLPSGPEGPAGPLLPAEAVLLYAYSSHEQIRTANALANYLTSPQQANRFMRTLGRVPANPNIRVDSRLYPIISGFTRQTRNGVTLPPDINKVSFFAAGDRAIGGMLAGTLSPEEAVSTFCAEVVKLLNLSDEESGLPPGCEPASEQ